MHGLDNDPTEMLPHVKMRLDRENMLSLGRKFSRSIQWRRSAVLCILLKLQYIEGRVFGFQDSTLSAGGISINKRNLKYNVTLGYLPT